MYHLNMWLSLLFLISYCYCSSMENSIDKVSKYKPNTDFERVIGNTMFTYTKDGILNIYNVLTYQGNYFQAVQKCNTKELKLLSIESQDENDYIFSKLKSNGYPNDYRFWSSGSVLADSPTWSWLSTGQHIGYFHWGENQPQNSSEEPCIAMYFDPRKNQTIDWHDWPCTQSFYTICKTAVKIFE